MAIVFLGISFLIQAVLHYFGWSLLIPVKYRKAEFRKQFQKAIAVPYAFLSISWIILSMVFNSFEEQDSFEFCMCLIIISIVPLILLAKNRKKYSNHMKKLLGGKT
ncbi:MAG: hypothetical protein AB7E42_07715 [Anaerotignaceae bacterium]